MDIDKLIQQEAPNDSEHDRCYAKALRCEFTTYNGLARGKLLDLQRSARVLYGKDGGTHYSTARCVVLYNLLK